MSRFAALLTWALLAVAGCNALPAHADGPELLKIIGQDKQFVIQTPSGAFTITRTMTVCARNKGFLQPLVPLV